MHPANKLSNLKRRVDRARVFPTITCPASRHLHNTADLLSSVKSNRSVVLHDPVDFAVSIYAVLESLWKARSKLKRIKGK